MRYFIVQGKIKNQDKMNDSIMKEHMAYSQKAMDNGLISVSYTHLYDPQQGTAICVNGQLLLLDLIEKVELEFGDKAIFIQGNTDGVMFKFNSKEDVDRYLEICSNWCKRTGMELEHDFIKKIIQKDVNNYIYIKEDGQIKSKGDVYKRQAWVSAPAWRSVRLWAT